MDKEIKKKWLEALRSGKYKKGFNTMKRRNKDSGDIEYCCLGVLCEVCGIKSENGIKAPKFIPLDLYYYEFENSSNYEFPDDDFLIDIVGMYEIGDDGMRVATIYDLARINDEDETDSFENIADYIEEKL